MIKHNKKVNKSSILLTKYNEIFHLFQHIAYHNTKIVSKKHVLLTFSKKF